MSSPNLHAALAAAMGHVSGAPKSARNDQQRYDYTSTETMISHCRGALRAEGLSIIPIGEEVEHRCEPVEAKTSKGTPYTRDLWTIRFRWLLAHSSGESVEMARIMPAESGPGRPLDKAKAGAASMALSYLLRDLLLIPRGEREVEVDARDDSDYVPPAASAPQAAGPTPVSIIRQAIGDTPPQAVGAFLKAKGMGGLPLDDAAGASRFAAWWGREGAAMFAQWESGSE